MIVLNLQCDNGHRFEGWFASAEAFRAQSGRALVACPQCASHQVSQLPAGPHVRRQPASTAGVRPAGAEAARELYRALADMARRAEDVGERFPEEARRIHYDEAPARTIRGVASADETRELIDEGIVVLPAPLSADGEVH